MAYITKEYLENNIKNYDQYRKLDKEGQANGLATLDANGKLVSTQIPEAAKTTYNGSPVTSIVAGSNTAMSLTNGALTIASTAAGNGNVPAYTSADAKKILTVNNNGTSAVWAEFPNATIYRQSDLGGIKIGTGGTKQFNYIWDSPGEAETGISVTTTDFPVTVYQPNRAHGKYYPVECTKDSTAVVCIPNVPSSFYEENTSDPFIFTIEDYTVGGVAKKGLSITCPSNVIFAQLDLPVTLPSITTPLLATVQSTKVADKQTLSIQSSAPEAGFTPGKTSYAYLRFTTRASSYQGIKAHTYNATVVVSYKSGSGTYSTNIAF